MRPTAAVRGETTTATSARNTAIELEAKRAAEAEVIEARANMILMHSRRRGRACGGASKKG